MESLYLDSDESILLTTQTMVVDGARYEAVLTGKRLILVRTDDPKAAHLEIPLDVISSAIAGENSLREPTITLAITTPDGVLNTVQLVFIRQVSEQKNHQFDEWVNRLKERVKVTVEEPAHAPHGSAPAEMPGIPAAPAAGQAAPSASGTPDIPAYVFRPPRPVTVPQEVNVNRLLTLVIVVAVAAVCLLVAAQFLQARGPAAVPGGGAPAATPVPTVLPPSAVTPSPTPSLAPGGPAAAPVPQVLVPASGIWVRVRFPGPYFGYIGTRGSMREVNTSGDRFYQVPATSGIIEAEITKMDNTGDLMALELYREGTLVKRVNSTAPRAILYLHEGL